MNSPWKLTTIGLGVAVVTALTSGLTTAYLLRAGTPAASAESDRHPASLAGVRVAPPAELEGSRRPPIVHVARTATVVAPARQDRVARETVTEPLPAEPVPSVVRTEPATTTVASAPRPEPVATPTVASTPASAPADCATGGDRAMRIAKPGAIGALVGAGVGAVGGAIADGGSGAGKGALWGGLAGAALGSGYGAYKTKQECGTIFGGDKSGTPAAATDRVMVGTPGQGTPAASSGAEAPFAARATATTGEGMTIYNVR